MVDWPDLLSEHCLGEFGEFGRYDDAVELTAGQVFALGLESEAVQNQHAVATGYGQVRGRFTLPADLQRHFPPHESGPRRAVVDVVTALHKGVQPRTLMTYSFISP